MDALHAVHRSGGFAELVKFGDVAVDGVAQPVHVQDLFGSLLAAGIMGHIMIQVILNIAVVTNTIPNTGITLPFISYGGTSVVFLLAEIGLALSVSREVKKEH